jgi:hypothetical protein
MTGARDYSLNIRTNEGTRTMTVGDLRSYLYNVDENLEIAVVIPGDILEVVAVYKETDDQVGDEVVMFRTTLGE